MTTFESFTYWLEELPLSILIGETWLFPLLESLHVIGAVFVFGAILMADLRLIGLAGKSYAANVFVKQLLPWSIAGFVLAFITGLGMFITRAGGYLNNPAFLWKMALLALALGNIIYFHRWLKSRVENAVGSNLATPVRLSGLCSLVLWTGVMLAGRWVGHIF